jgi:polysaccharide biosynthesis transport protein
MDSPTVPERGRELTITPRRDLVRAIPLAVGKIEPEFLEEGERASVLRTWRTLARYKWLILVGIVLGGLLGLGITLAQTPMYRAHTTLEIQGINDAFLNLRDTSAVSPSFDVQTQARALQSQTLRQRALRRVRDDLASVPESKREPSVFNLWHPPSRDSAIRDAAKNLTVIAARDSRIIDVLSDSSDPDIAARFTNALTTEYVGQILQWRLETGARTSEWLSGTLQGVKAKLEESEETLQEYAQASRLIFHDDKSTNAEDSLKHLQTELARARTDRLNREAQWAIASASPVEHLPEVVTNGTINQYLSQLTELRQQRAQLATAFTPSYPKVKRLQAQIAELEQAIERDRSIIINRIRTETQAAVQRETLLQNAYDRQVTEVSAEAGRVMHYTILKQEVDSNRRLYENMLKNMNEAGVSAAMRPNNVRIVDPASPPSQPFTPRTILNVAGGLMTGLVFACLTVLLRDAVDHSLNRPGDARSALNIPELGAIPFFKAEPLSGVNHKRLTPVGGNGDRMQPRVELAMRHQRPSPVAESFRAALASILFLNEGGEPPKVISVTSPGSKEGKTNVISNLGIALTEINRKVVLVDGDMRAPALHRVFDVSNNWGLSDLLKQKESLVDCPIEGLVRKTDIPNLFLLPSGPGTISTSQLLYSPRTSELLARLRHEFDAVLIDTPPMRPVADARVLSRLTDGVILVIRAGRTHRDAATAAVQRFREDGTPVLGAILNDWDPRRADGVYEQDAYDGDPADHLQS